MVLEFRLCHSQSPYFGSLSLIHGTDNVCPGVPEDPRVSFLRSTTPVIQSRLYRPPRPP